MNELAKKTDVPTALNRSASFDALNVYRNLANSYKEDLLNRTGRSIVFKEYFVNQADTKDQMSFQVVRNLIAIGEMKIFQQALEYHVVVEMGNDVIIKSTMLIPLPMGAIDYMEIVLLNMNSAWSNMMLQLIDRGVIFIVSSIQQEQRQNKPYPTFTYGS